MRIVNTVVILTSLSIPAIGFGAGPTPPEPGDLPIGVLTAGGTLVDMPGGGVYAVVDERTYYSPADGSPTIDCDEKPLECVTALRNDENADPPEDPPPADPPPVDDPPKKPKKPKKSRSASRVNSNSCDYYVRTDDGETCMIVETRYDSGVAGNVLFLSCPVYDDCFFADAFHYFDVGLDIVDDVEILGIGVMVTSSMSARHELK